MWREMHVKTDVFCAGSIILPDKAGRQINVGGWSLESTFGVRLYTPDGHEGVNSTNDWEENFQVLSLQVSLYSLLVLLGFFKFFRSVADGTRQPPFSPMDLYLSLEGRLGVTRLPNQILKFFPSLQVVIRSSTWIGLLAQIPTTCIHL